MSQPNHLRIARLLVLAGAALVLSLAAVADASAQYVNSYRPPSINVRPTIPNVGTNIRPHYTPNFKYGPDGAPSGSQAQNDAPPPRKKTVKTDNPSTFKPAGTNTAQQNSAPQQTARIVPNEVLIEISGNPPQSVVDELARRHRLVRVQSQPFPSLGTTMYRWQILDGRSVTEVARAIVAGGGVLDARPNQIYTAQQSQVTNPGDPAQYTLAKLRIPLAHELTRGDKILVAVIDSGIDVDHPELKGVIADSFDSLDSQEPPHAHGTAIAGAIAAHQRLLGAAPNARILAVRAFGAASSGAEGTAFNILRSIDWAIGRGARVINMSFAGPRDPGLSRILAAARQRGIVLVAATGNAGAKSPPLYPAADPNVIAVTATDAEDKLFVPSNRGSYVSVTAPGVDILLPAPNAGYQVTSGTSFAAAHVSGVAALVLGRNPGLGADSVRRILLTSARDLGPKGRDDFFGAGLVDAFQAVTAAQTKTVGATTAGSQAAR